MKKQTGLRWWATPEGETALLGAAGVRDEAIAYVRAEPGGVDDQALEAQRADVRRCARDLALDLVDEIVEQVPVDRPPNDRPALMHLQRQLEASRPSCVIISGTDVFASPGDESAFADLLRGTTLVVQVDRVPSSD